MALLQRPLGSSFIRASLLSLTTSCSPAGGARPEAAGGTTSPLLLIGTRGSVLAAGREQAGAGWDSFQADRKVEGSEEHSPASGSFHACFLTGSQRVPHEVGTLVLFYRLIQSPSLPATRD